MRATPRETGEVVVAIAPMLMTRAQVAKVLALSPGTIDRLTREGRLRAVTPDGINERRWRRSDVRAYVRGLGNHEEGSG